MSFVLTVSLRPLLPPLQEAAGCQSIFLTKDEINLPLKNETLSKLRRLAIEVLPLLLHDFVLFTFIVLNKYVTLIGQHYKYYFFFSFLSF